MPRSNKVSPRLSSSLMGSPEYAALIWALKSGGDINENYEGGNAVRTLKQRLEELGYPLDAKTFSNKIHYLYKNGVFKRINDGHRTYCIRLSSKFTELPENPFSDAIHNEVAGDLPKPLVEIVGEMKDDSLLIRHQGQLYKALPL